MRDGISEVNDDMYVAITKELCKDMDYIVTLSQDIDKMYSYLLEIHLITPLNRTEFNKSVKEIYLEIAQMLYDEERDVYPSVGDVSTFVDEENIAIIEDFFEKYELDDNDTQLIITKYTTEVSSYLYDEIKMTLRNDGLPYRNDSILVEDDMRLVSGPLDPNQQVLFYDFFY